MARSRRGTKRRSKSERLTRAAFRTLTNPYPPINVLSTDQIESIHQTSLLVLRDLGMKVLDRGARDRLVEAGASADHDTQMVKFDPQFVEETVALAPSKFTLKARNPEHSLTVGENYINFMPVAGPSFVSDLDNGRRAGTIEEMRNFLKIVHELGVLHIGGASPFEPMDLPAESRHLDKYYAGITCHDKIWSASLLGGYRARDALAMIRIVHGMSDAQMLAQPVLLGNINTNSPRQLDANMSDGLTALASLGQPVVVTPFTLLGAMAPTTMAGALVQQNAEALAGIVLTQVVRPGAPVVYGGFTSNVDMKSGAPAFGTPEYVKCTQAGAQLARRHGLPFRASNTNASNIVDAQAAYESEMSLWGAIMGHTNLVNHGAGWLEGGLVGSFEKLIIDAEMLQMMAEYLQPMIVDDDQLALDAIAEVQPGGHYFGAAHTLSRYEDAFYSPLVSDWRNFETWADTGALNATERANKVWKTLLQEYVAPALDPAIDEALRDYMTRRKREISAGIDAEI